VIGGVAPRQVASRQWRIIKMFHLAKLHIISPGGVFI